ncbi:MULTISPECIES: hypothetical protein [Streptomyces]|uniref:hypothetical protein n=1 Tax=Streptomyces TaxID=1883 RepID=UPI001601BC56|nr:hypothetical protein [Streptomyces murinus]MBA9050785.1 hypothetical protein [Streptomyces murinus]
MPTKNDVTGETFAVEFNGETYDVAPAEEWDLDVLEAIDDNKLTHALKALLGAEQYTKFRAANKKVRDLGAFFDAAGKKVGAGNS